MSQQFLQRALALAERHRHEQRELACLLKRATSAAEQAEDFWSFLYEEDPAHEEYRQGLRRFARTEASLRVAVDNLVGMYCGEIRLSPWYRAAQERRSKDVTETHAVFSTERRLMGLAREVRRSIAALQAEISSSSRHALDFLVGLDGELSIFERWRQIRYKVTRLSELIAETEMPSLDLVVPDGVYINRTPGWLDEVEDFIWAYSEIVGKGASQVWRVSLTMRSLSDGLLEWLSSAEAFVLDEPTHAAERAQQDLEEDIVAAAHERLPESLRPWHMLLTEV